MKYLIHIMVTAVFLGIATAYWIDANGYPFDEDNDMDAALGVMNTVKRGGYCMRWGMVCVPGSPYKFTKCCSGLNCACNIWKTHCKCRAKLG